MRWNLAHLRLEGVVVPQDLAAAAQLATSACDGGAPVGRAVLASVHLNRSTPEDLERARALLQKACDGGVARACHPLTSLPE